MTFSDFCESIIFMPEFLSPVAYSNVFGEQSHTIFFGFPVISETKGKIEIQIIILQLLN